MKHRIATIATLAIAFFLPAIAIAAPAAAEQTSGPNDGIYALAMLLGVGAAALGCGLGQGKAASAALEGIARNPNASDKVFTPMLIALAFPESLTIFTLVAALLVFAKFGF